MKSNPLSLEEVSLFEIYFNVLFMLSIYLFCLVYTSFSRPESHDFAIHNISAAQQNEVLRRSSDFDELFFQLILMTIYS